ncbi:MAG TPA: response regulator [Bacteroidales bacterium]|nr:response regulator [Bacteroidales bacterium]
MKNKNNYRLILLEDEPAHAEVIKRTLSGSEVSYEILEAGSIREYKQIISNGIPDLILADINLPDGSAMDLLNADSEEQTLPILVMTSYGDEETAVKAMKSGAIDYLVKSPDSFRNIDLVVQRNIRAWINIRQRKETEKQFRTLFETMGQGVVYQDATGAILTANPAAERILGLSIEQLKSRTSFNSEWKSIHEDGTEFPGEEHPALQALNSGLPVKDVIMGVYNPSKNEQVWILISAIPQFNNSDEKPNGVYTTFTDITELKNTEYELKKAKEKAEESDRLKSAFMANMSHEIRTPMNGVLGFAELLKRPALSEETRLKYAQVIEMSGKRMLSIINDLIDISRIEAGLIEVKNEKTNIRGLLNELLLLFTPESQNKGITLASQVDLPKQEFIIDTDKTKLGQILTNLIKNALKFTERGGQIELGCRLQNGMNLLFFVKDTGVGIRKDLQEKIFERFRQVETTNPQDGIGLGLAISKAYVELMGGKMYVESEPGIGSIFSFSLPCQIDEEFFQGETHETQVNLIPCLNVLIAEDDEISYLFLKESLKQRNIVTCRAKNGLDAVNMIKNSDNINLVLMDIKMPIMNGIDAIKEIKKIKPKTPIIAQSAFATEKEVSSTIEAGSDDYITKPVDINKLVKKISTFVNV